MDGKIVECRDKMVQRELLYRVKYVCIKEFLLKEKGKKKLACKTLNIIIDFL